MGGVLGLCTGFSLITAVELLYWFTVRIFNDYRNRKKISPKSSEDNWSDDEQEEQKPDCDCEAIKSRMEDLETRNVKIENLLKEFLHNTSGTSVRLNDQHDQF